MMAVRQSGMVRVAVLLGTVLLVLLGRQVQAAPRMQPDQPVLVVTGLRETVFDWTTDRCEDGDIPDLPARAFRDAQGQAQLIATHYTARRSMGPDLDHLVHDCRVIMDSDLDGDPAMFNDHEWLAGLYTEDGQTIYATVHNEYQGHTHAGQCPTGQYFDCWYNSLTAAVSSDGGLSYVHAAQPPNHLVGTLPYPYEGGAGPYGMFEPTNIIKGKDGYYYEFFRVDDYPSAEQWTCLMRTDNLADPRAWRAWDGETFSLELLNPYTQEITRPRQQICAPISPNEIGVMHESVTYNTYLERYVLVGTSADQINGRETWGIYYAFSDDLIHWTRRQLLFASELTWTYQPGDDNPIAYPSLLDTDSLSRNFETTDQTATLYFTRFNNQNTATTLDRDLVRVPVQFFRSAEEAQNPDAVTYLSAEIVTGADAVSAIAGALTSSDGQPVADAPLTVTIWPSEEATYESTVTGTVPVGAVRAVVGYRVNMECGCVGDAEFSLYEMRYSEGQNGANRIANPAFEAGLSDWAVFGGNGSSTLQPRTDGSGMMVHVVSESPRSTAINSAVFSVTAGADFTFTAVARQMAGIDGSGYFALMFLDANGEIARTQIPFATNALAHAEVVTDAEGHYTTPLPEDVSAPVMVDVWFAGDVDHLAVSALASWGE